MICNQLPNCLAKCVDVLADLHAQKWKERLIVANFAAMAVINAPIEDIQKDYEDICFESVNVWVNESALLHEEAQRLYADFIRVHGTPPCISSEGVSGNYRDFDNDNSDLDEISELEQDALSKDCNTCRDAGQACNGCSVYLLEFLYP